MFLPEEISYDYKTFSDGLELRFFTHINFVMDNVLTFFPGSHVIQKAGITTVVLKAKGAVSATIHKNELFLRIEVLVKNGVDNLLRPVKKPEPKKITKQQAVKEAMDELDSEPLRQLVQKMAHYFGDAVKISPDIAKSYAIVQSKKGKILIQLKELPIAAFEDNGNVFVFLQSDDPINTLIDPKVKEKIENKVYPQGILLSFTPHEGCIASINKLETGWEIDLDSRNVSGAKPLIFEEKGEDYFSKAPGIGNPIHIENYIICTTSDANIYSPYELDNPHVLATAAGFVAKNTPLETVVVKEDQIFLLCKDIKNVDSHKEIEIDIPHIHLDKPFFALRKDLIEKLETQKDEHKNSSLDYELITLYLSFMLGAEAKAEIARLIEQNPETDNLKTTILFAIGCIMDGADDKEALDRIKKYKNKSKLGALWYSFLVSYFYRDPLPVHDIDTIIQMISSFDSKAKSFLLLRIADLLVESNPKQAKDLIDQVPDESLSSSDIRLKSFLNLVLSEALDKNALILKYQELLTTTTDPFLQTKIILENGVISPKSKPCTFFYRLLDNLLPMIENTPYFLPALKMLVDYYFEKKDYLHVLSLVSIIREHFPDEYFSFSKRVADILQSTIRMKLLNKIGLSKACDIFISFIDEFSSDPNQCEFVLNLIERITPMGLLDKALLLLEKYLDKKLAWNDQQLFSLSKALLGLYLQAGFTEKATDLVNHLDESKHDKQVGDIDVNLLKVQLALEKNEFESALEFLQDNYSYEALKIKLNTLWKLDKWQEAAETVTEILERYKSSLRSDMLERYVIQLAEALVLAESKKENKQASQIQTQKKLTDAVSKYLPDMKKYADLIKNLTFVPYDSIQDHISKPLIQNELNEVDRLKDLFNKIKVIPTN